jgi:hypothetical protein
MENAMIQVFGGKKANGGIDFTPKTGKSKKLNSISFPKYFL